MESLLQLFDAIQPLPEEDQLALVHHWTEEVSLKRRENLIEPDSLDDSIYFLQEGTMRIFFEHDGEEYCVGFCYPGTIVVSVYSFFRAQPSQYYIQAIKACKMIRIRKADFNQIKATSTALQTAWQFLTEEALIGKIERETEMLTLTPSERYEKLLERSPHVFQLIPRKYIASYLRMQPET